MYTEELWSYVIVFLMLVIKSSEAACHPGDKQVLLQIKQHFNNSDLVSDWDPETDCCDWKRNILCGPTGRVTALFIDDSKELAGEIPAIIGELPFLEVLVFDQLPHLTGSIPESFTKLTKLEELTLTINNLSGPIPEFLSQMKSLVKLRLSSNRFSGTIPSSLSLLPNLFELYLDSNLLNGSVPESFGSFKNTLSLGLDNNHLSGPIPKSLGTASFTLLNLSYNNLTGDATFLFGREKPLKEMWLRMNEFEFNLSKVELALGIDLFDIANNKIYGSIPRQFAQLGQLEYFDVSNNQLCGKVPKGRRFKQFGPNAFAHNKCLCDALGLPPCL